MDVFLPELLRITHLCRSCVTHPAGFTAQSCQSPGMGSIWTLQLQYPALNKGWADATPRMLEEQAGALRMCVHSGQDKENQGWGKPITTK